VEDEIRQYEEEWRQRLDSLRLQYDELQDAEAREADRIARSGGAPAGDVPIYWHGSIPVGLFAMIVFNLSGSRK
jgi:hypothetical protein